MVEYLNKIYSLICNLYVWQVIKVYEENGVQNGTNKIGYGK
jgi:hypothetical protein